MRLGINLTSGTSIDPSDEFVPPYLVRRLFLSFPGSICNVLFIIQLFRFHPHLKQDMSHSSLFSNVHYGYRFRTRFLLVCNPCCTQHSLVMQTNLIVQSLLGKASSKVDVCLFRVEHSSFPPSNIFNLSDSALFPFCLYHCKC